MKGHPRFVTFGWPSYLGIPDEFVALDDLETVEHERESFRVAANGAHGVIATIERERDQYRDKATDMEMQLAAQFDVSCKFHGERDKSRAALAQALADLFNAREQLSELASEARGLRLTVAARTAARDRLAMGANMDLRFERDALREKLAEAEAERFKLTEELTATRAERDAAVIDRDACKVERDSARRVANFALNPFVRVGVELFAQSMKKPPMPAKGKKK